MNAAGTAAGPGIHRPGGLLWHRDFRLLWFGETVSQVGTAMAVVAMPLAAVTVLHAGTFAVTVLVAMTWLPWLLPGRGLTVYVLGTLIVASGTAAASIIIVSFGQAYSPPRMRGRVAATMSILLAGTSPLGALTSGALATAIGVRGTLWIMFGIVAASGPVLLTHAIRKNRDLPPTPRS